MKLRLHQFLSRTGIFAGKAAVIAAVRSGQVQVGSEFIVNPEYIFDPKRKAVLWRGKLLKKVSGNVYVAVHKPEGYLSSRLSSTDQKLGKRSIFSLIEREPALSDAVRKSLFCIGRLDEDTSGLLLLTNDGRLSAKITNPESSIGKKYEAVLQQPLGDDAKARLEEGVVINLEENGHITRYKTKGCVIELLSPESTHILLTLTEGKKREVRRMLEAVGNQVVELKRIAIGRLLLKDLGIKKGEWRIIDKKTVELAAAEWTHS